MLGTKPGCTAKEATMIRHFLRCGSVRGVGAQEHPDAAGDDPLDLSLAELDPLGPSSFFALTSLH
jgi:hypothetical protein